MTLTATERPKQTAAVSGVMSVKLTRTELYALKETIELSPVFEGRTQARDAIREVLRDFGPRPSPLCIEENILVALTQRIIPIDVPTAALHSKLDRALQLERPSAPPAKHRDRSRQA